LKNEPLYTASSSPPGRSRFHFPPELGFSTEHGAEEPEGDGAEETELRSRKEETTPAHVGGNAGEERYNQILILDPHSKKTIKQKKWLYLVNHSSSRKKSWANHGWSVVGDGDSGDDPWA
jgi:hypothetical protein